MNKSHPFNLREEQQNFAWDCLPTYTKRVVRTIYSQLSEEYRKLDKNCSTSTYMLGKVEILNNLFGNNNITGLNNKTVYPMSLIKDFIDDQCNHFNIKEFEPKFHIGDVVKHIDSADLKYKIIKVYFDDSISSFRYTGDNISDTYNEDELELVTDPVIIDNVNKQPELLKEMNDNRIAMLKEHAEKTGNCNNIIESAIFAKDYLNNKVYVGDIVIITEKHNTDRIEYGIIKEIHDDNLITVHTSYSEKLLVNANACKLCKNTSDVPTMVGVLNTDMYNRIIDYNGETIKVGTIACTMQEKNYIGIIDSINIEAKTVSINGNNYGIAAIYVKPENELLHSTYCYDVNKNELYVKDIVKINNGPYKDVYGYINKIYTNQVAFIVCENITYLVNTNCISKTGGSFARIPDNDIVSNNMKILDFYGTEMKYGDPVYSLDKKEYLGYVKDFDQITGLVTIEDEANSPYCQVYAVEKIYVSPTGPVKNADADKKDTNDNSSKFERGTYVLVTGGPYEGKTGIITESDSTESMVKIDDSFIKVFNKELQKTDIQPCNLESEESEVMEKIMYEYKECDEFKQGDYVEITRDLYTGKKGRIHTINAVYKVALVEIDSDISNGKINMVCIPFSNLKLINKDHTEFNQMVEDLHNEIANTPKNVGAHVFVMSGDYLCKYGIIENVRSTDDGDIADVRFDNGNIHSIKVECLQVNPPSYTEEKQVECNHDNYVKFCADDPVLGTSESVDDKSNNRMFASDVYECTDDKSDFETDYDEQKSLLKKIADKVKNIINL